MATQIIPVPAIHPYTPEHGDLECVSDRARAYLDDIGSTKKKREQIIPLTVVAPSPFTALRYLGIDFSLVMSPYECPYTNYRHYGVVPTALCSNDIKGKYKHILDIGGITDYWLNWEYHKRNFGDTHFHLRDIAQILFGSGWTLGTGVHDGSRSHLQTRVWLDNGDYLWVHFWEWHNK